ncbi:unnamed protein product [Paramecium primaurelia]|uniref:Uncharacterized protein n=2 Tax=Paramecium TaxID=5884 RepID=A0A8S1W971_9CILI|nr:unnamed protein product [Paramecium primaurelia]CAD8185363.1 unnamed protein product [Paramecium pentaurelia]
MLPQQIIYRQVRHSPQKILRQSTILPHQQLRTSTPIRQQRSYSHFDQQPQSSMKKQQENFERENDLLREKVKQLKQQIASLEQNYQNNAEIEEQYIVALRIFQQLKIESEQLRLELSYIKQENNLLKSKLKQINY